MSTYITCRLRLRSRRILLAATLFVPLVASPAMSKSVESKPGQIVPGGKQLIGPTAKVEETESDLDFQARVDTGATTSSLHVEEWVIEDESDKMADNIGKTMRIRLKNRRGQSEWIKRKIVDLSTIKTSEQEEERYKVLMTLRYNDVKKRVLVSLNDRSHMTYPALLGRNFLRDDFVVDVSLKPERMKLKPQREKEGKSLRSGKERTTRQNG